MFVVKNGKLYKKDATAGEHTLLELVIPIKDYFRRCKDAHDRTKAIKVKKNWAKDLGLVVQAVYDVYRSVCPHCILHRTVSKKPGAGGAKPIQPVYPSHRWQIDLIDMVKHPDASSQEHLPLSTHALPTRQHFLSLPTRQHFLFTNRRHFTSYSNVRYIFLLTSILYCM